MRKQLLLVFLGAAFATALPAATILDGTFSTPSLASAQDGFEYNPAGSPWTFIGASGIAAQGLPLSFPWYTVTAPGGSGQAAFLQDYVGSNTKYSGHPGLISQSITGLTPGDTYTVSFYAAQRPNFTVNPFSVYVGPTSLVTVTPGSTSFVQYSGTFTAGLSSELLEFESLTGPVTGPYDYDSVIADVTVTPGTVTTPEPGTFVLLLPALAALAVYMRRRRPASQRA